MEFTIRLKFTLIKLFLFGPRGGSTDVYLVNWLFLWTHNPAAHLIIIDTHVNERNGTSPTNGVF